MSSATACPTCLLASHACWRLAESLSLLRICLISLSVTLRPSIVPRNVLKFFSYLGAHLDDLPEQLRLDLIGQIGVL